MLSSLVYPRSSLPFWRHSSTQALKAAIRDYIEVEYAHPKPFIWTKTADAILASVERFFVGASQTQQTRRGDA